MDIAKKIKFKSAGYGWLVIQNNSIGYRHCNGPMPKASNVLHMMLADRDVRRLVREYASHGYEHCRYIDCKIGMSGCADFYINIVEFFGGEAHIIGRKKLLHISCADKLNEALPMMFIGDFIDLISYLRKNSGLVAPTMARKLLRNYSGAKYIYEYKPNQPSYRRWGADLFKEVDSNV